MASRTNIRFRRKPHRPARRATHFGRSPSRRLARKVILSPNPFVPLSLTYRRQAAPGFVARPGPFSTLSHVGVMARNPLEPPPEVARRFFKDLSAFLVEKDPIKADAIAARQLQALREYQGPQEKKLRLSDVKQIFLQMKNHA